MTTITKATRTVLYARVSTIGHGQDVGLQLDDQRGGVVEHEQGWTLTDEADQVEVRLALGLAERLRDGIAKSVDGDDRDQGYESGRSGKTRFIFTALRTER